MAKTTYYNVDNLATKFKYNEYTRYNKVNKNFLDTTEINIVNNYIIIDKPTSK